jgi:acetyl-CoA carboxylase biotin carboxyl carrier protein
MALSDEDVREILRIIDESPLDELRIETDAFSLHVRKGSSADAPPVADRVPSRPPAPAPAPASARPPATPTQAAGPPAAETEPDNRQTISSPMLGTFYRAQAPGSPPFVELGAQVEPDTIVCIIEVMKMMNSVPAGVSGTVVEICSENAQLVEYGEPLFRLRVTGAP